MSKLIKKAALWAFAAISGFFTFVPESVFGVIHWRISDSIANSELLGDVIKASTIDIIFNRVLCLLTAWCLTALITWIYTKWIRKSVRISDDDYEVKVEYGDITKIKDCKRVISFDECFTTTVGNRPEDINPNSICGLYLKDNPIHDMEQLIQNAHISPMSSKSKFQKKTRYKSGSLVPRGSDLLMAFAHLDSNGLGMFPSYADYIDALITLWDEINVYYGQHDVCVPILGAGVTRFPGGRNLSAQEALNLMLWTYRKSSAKIKKPHKLRVICKKRDDFSLDCIEVD